RDVREKSLYGLAECLSRVGKMDEARSTWTQQVTMFPSGPQSRLAYFRLGTAAFSKGEIENAKNFYMKTLENSTDKELSIKAKFSLAECLEAEDSLNEALKLYKEIEPEYSNREAIQIKIRALEARIIKKKY
ncbi:MAG TPA: tetratricopeptide repeat protein, partial [Nitrospirota bacterium]|nr:tetratricopeptide repeat protein [Nitrospirota bacterium]